MFMSVLMHLLVKTIASSEIVVIFHTSHLVVFIFKAD